MAREVVQAHRARVRRAERVEEVGWLELPQHLLPPRPRHLRQRELAERVYALVEQLDDETREAVHLHYYQGLSLSETSEVLNVPTSTLKYRLREALNTLRSQTAEPKFITGERS